MLNYYDEMKNDIIEALEYDYKEILESAENKEDAYYQLEDVFFVSDSITGNASGSYYFNSYESRKHCYEYFRDVEEALEEFDFEALDVITRCYLLGGVLCDVLDKYLD